MTSTPATIASRSTPEVDSGECHGKRRTHSVFIDFESKSKGRAGNETYCHGIIRGKLMELHMHSESEADNKHHQMLEFRASQLSPMSPSVSSEIELSDFETQFVPQENDSELLWEVIEITAEKGKKYKVKWAGINPKTGKAWPQEWVAKHDCTDHIVKAWKLKQAKKKKAKEKLKEKRKSKGVGRRKVELEVVHPVSRGPKQSTGKTKPGKGSSVDDDGGWEADTDVHVTRVKGKARVVGDTESRSEEEEEEDDGDDEEEEEDPPPPETVIKIGPPRGLKGRTSTNRSTVTSTSSKKPSTSKDTTSVASKKDFTPGKVSSVLGKRKSRTKESLRSAASEEENALQKPSKRRLAPGPSIAQKSHPQKSSDTTNDDEVVEVLDISHTSRVVLSPAAQARLAAFDATQLSIEDDLMRLSPERVDMQDDPDYNDNNFVDPLPAPDLPAPAVPKYRSNGTVTTPSGGNSYRTGIVPETETESSTNNTQSQPAHLHSSPPRPSHPAATPVTPFSLPQSPRTPQRTSVKSRMKPRTPGSSPNLFPLLKPDASPKASVNTKPKSLQRVPAISPSTFHPHLPSSAPNESNVESVIEPAPDPEVECPLSSIEQFSSPEKLPIRTKRGGYEDGDRVIRERGQELADMATRQKQKEKKQDLFARKVGPKILTDILAAETQKAKKAKKSREKPSSRREVTRPLDSGAGSGDVPHVRDALGQPGSRADDAMLVQEMEDRYVDLNGGAMDVDLGPGLAGLDPRVFLRQEEEESTQDLRADMHARANVGAVGGTVEDTVGGVVAKRTELVETNEHEEGNSPDQDQPASDLDRRDAKSRSRSIPSRHQAELNSQPVSPMASTGHPLPDLHMAPRSQTPPTKYYPAPNTQSEDISRLEQVLKDERDRMDALAKEIISLKDTLAQASATATSNAADLQQQLAETRDRQQKNGIAWDAERSTFVSSLDILTRSKLAAEADRDFFREQYAQASGYVSSVRKENGELEARAAIAEKQAKDGVSMIRNTFQERVKTLETELVKSKSITALLMEKDQRTGDEIRRKAGEEPELRARCGKLEEKAQRLAEENAALAADLNAAEEEKEALEQVMQVWRKDLMRVDVEVRAYKTKMERLVSLDALEGEDDLAYRCEWRLDTNIPCESIFPNTEGLQGHLLEEHLHRD